MKGQKSGIADDFGGNIGSWVLCAEDQDWINRDRSMSYSEYKKYYHDLMYKFKPDRFTPEAWAETLSKLICLQTGKSVRWKKIAEGIEVSLPTNLPADLSAIAFRMNSELGIIF